MGTKSYELSSGIYSVFSADNDFKDEYTVKPADFARPQGLPEHLHEEVDL